MVGVNVGVTGLGVAEAVCVAVGGIAVLVLVTVGEIVTAVFVKNTPPVGVIAGALKIVLLRMTTPELAEYAVLNSLLFSITTLEGLTPLDTITLQR